MILSFDRSDYDSKKIYFALTNAFNLADDPLIHDCHAGVYAIYNGDICSYVGQSKNLPSRLATHLYGHFSNATRVDIYTAANNGFPRFGNFSEDEKQTILNNNEDRLIKHFKPTENILVERGINATDNEIFNCIIDLCNGGAQVNDIDISLDGNNVIVRDYKRIITEDVALYNNNTTKDSLSTLQ